MLKIARRLSMLAWMALPALALAHEGHGMEGSSHWHANDALIWVALVAAAALAWARRK